MKVRKKLPDYSDAADKIGIIPEFGEDVEIGEDNPRPQTLREINIHNNCQFKFGLKLTNNAKRRIEEYQKKAAKLEDGNIKREELIAKIQELRDFFKLDELNKKEKE